MLLVYSKDRTDANNDDISYVDTKYILNDAETVYTGRYDSSDDTSEYILPTGAGITSDTDIFDRLSSRSIKDSNNNDIITYTYSYENRTESGTNYTSKAVSSVSTTNGTSYSYTYDNTGNITGVTRASDPFMNAAGVTISYTVNPIQTTYEYDELGELVRENNPAAGKTWVYAYDSNGNIVSRNEYAFTTRTLPATPDSVVSYTYGNSTWKDQLTCYGSQTITYDTQGNPANWINGEALTWDGRRLASWDDGTDTFTLVYDDSGLRTRTECDNTTVAEYLYDSEGKIFKCGSVLYYYDEDGAPIGFKQASRIYYYQYNEQGDVTGLVNDSGDLVAIYEYDAWGNLIDWQAANGRAFTAARTNIYRYRARYGYVYDTVLGLYYLKTRFYDPKVGRFLNEDDPDYLCVSGTTLGGNLYTYCENGPITCVDPYGTILYIKDLHEERFFMYWLRKITSYHLYLKGHTVHISMEINDYERRIGNALIRCIIQSSKTVYLIKRSYGPNEFVNENRYAFAMLTRYTYGVFRGVRYTRNKGCGGTVYINPNFMDNSSVTFDLAHELIHALRAIHGLMLPIGLVCMQYHNGKPYGRANYEELYTVGLNYRLNQYGYDRLFRCFLYFFISENAIRAEHRQVLRPVY